MADDLLARWTEIVSLARTDPARAADLVDELGSRLHQWADALRRRAERADSKGSMNDRVQVRVVGPDGTVKQETDTGGGP